MMPSSKLVIRHFYDVYWMVCPTPSIYLPVPNKYGTKVICYKGNSLVGREDDTIKYGLY